MTIIIPYANNQTDFAVLLMQLQMQKVPPNAIYVADNSPDGSGFNIVKRYQFSVPIVVEKKAGSIYESWNKGIKFAGGDDVVILNDDILIPFDFCEVMGEVLASKKADAYCPASAGFPPVRRVRDNYAFYPNTLIKIDIVNTVKSTHVPTIKGWCFALPRTTIEKIGLFDEQFNIWYGDKDYEKRIFDAGGKIMFLENFNVHHFGTSSYSKISKKKYLKNNYTDQIKYEKKHDVDHINMGWDKYAK